MCSVQGKRIKNILQITYVPHIRVNTQEAVAISLDWNTQAMVRFNLIRNTNPCNRFCILQKFLLYFHTIHTNFKPTV